VRVRDVVESFPLNDSDSKHKYLLRFEMLMQISPARKMVVWMDLDSELDIQAPNVKGRIRVKALRLPTGVGLKTPLKQSKAIGNPSAHTQLHDNRQ
jgi:hypothetical protein